jgi:dienelactone hydrolase
LERKKIVNRILLCLLISGLALPLLAGQASQKFAAQKARTIMQELAAHQFQKVATESDEQMRAALPAEKLAAVWSSLETQVGKFEAIRGVVVSHPAATITMVTLVCQFEHANLDAILAFNSAGQLAGLRFRPAESGSTKWSVPAYAQPDSFTESAVTVTTGRWKLPGTLTVPKAKGPFPAVVLVAGSGPEDQDETIGPNKPFKDLAWGLASRGVAVLRYEKRTKKYGLDSSADPAKMTVNDETVDDARSAVALLAANPAIDPHRIFVVGHSLGAVMAPRIATGDRKIAGIVLMAGAITPIERLALEQVRTIAAREHVPEKVSEPQIAALQAEVHEIESPKLKMGETVNFLGAKIPASYWLDLRGYHPGRVAAVLHIPILILQGGRDYQVPPSEMELWKKALAGHKNVTYELYPALNHLFIAGTGPSTPKSTLKPGHVDGKVVAGIAGWVKAETGR